MKKTGIVLCTYNRPQYLRRCLESIRRSDLSLVTEIMIMDDGSRDEETLGMIKEFSLPDVLVERCYKGRNRSIKDSLLMGYDYFFGKGFDIVMNIDGDALVRNDFVDILINLKSFFRDNIITGFNCNTKNKNGTQRHPLLHNGTAYVPGSFSIDYSKRGSVGGINMVIEKDQYDKYVRPALVQCLEKGGNWDALTCKNAMADESPIICAYPSVIQHIGFNSSMGHTAAEEPDIADSFKSLHLPNVTLVCVDCSNGPGALHAIKRSTDNIEFGAVKFITHYTHFTDFPMTHFVKDTINIPRIKSKEEYSQFIFKDLDKYIETDYCLIVQHDGYVLNAEAWRKEWLEYDYIGATWRWYDTMKVGNGGFSLRSKKLLSAISNDKQMILVNDGLINNLAEDHNICRIYRPYLEGIHKINFATPEEAELFSIEAWNSKDRVWNGQFGFHGRSVKIPDNI